MGQGIARLEAELSRVEAERESARAAVTKAGGELERGRIGRAKVESTARALQAKLTELRDEERKALETVTAWVERASRAEARLEELAKRAGGQGDRS
jgi:chromosome segregation ATPase